MSPYHLVFVFTDMTVAISVTSFKMQNYKTVTMKLSYAWECWTKLPWKKADPLKKQIQIPEDAGETKRGFKSENFPLRRNKIESLYIFCYLPSNLGGGWGIL